MKSVTYSTTALAMDASSGNNGGIAARDVYPDGREGGGRDGQDPRERPARLQGVRQWFRHVLGGRRAAPLRDVLEEVLEEHEEQAQERLPPEEKAILRNVLSFGEIEVSDIMVPRTDIVAVPEGIALADLKAHLIEQRHTRIPVYGETLDHLLGFLHIKDLLPMLAADQTYHLKSVMRPLLFVPPSMRIVDLLVRMRHSGSHMAIVVDEHGGTDGLVTMEDLFEEIVGEIQDEHDGEEDKDGIILRIARNVYEVSARIRIARLERELGLNVVSEENEGEFDTLGGLIFFHLGRVPARGEVVPHACGARFEIVDADARRIHKVRIVLA